MTPILDLPALIHTCAPAVDAALMQAIIQTESNGNPLSLVDAGLADLPWSKRKTQVRSLQPANRQAAEKAATDLIAQGHIVAIGMAQVTSPHLQPLGLTVSQLFDPCTNIAVGARILQNFSAIAPDRQSALSAYNTGNFTSGIENGYVTRIIDRLTGANLAHGPRSPNWINPYSAPLEVTE